MNVFEITSLTSTEENSFAFAKELGLISIIPPICSTCNKRMHNERGKTRHAIDGRWRCSTRTCRKSISLFKDSIFEGKHLPLSTCIRIMYLHAMELNISSISAELKVTREAVSNTIAMFKNNILQLNMNSMFGKLGIANIPVEIDETHMISRRDWRGRILKSERYWIIGCICRLTKQVRFKLVRNRTSDVCLQFINENINRGSTIYSDMWRGYRSVSTNLFNHFTVNHSLGFINFDNNEIHTQNIERIWKELKKNVSKNVHSFVEFEKNIKYFEFEKNFLLRTSSEKFNSYMDFNKI